MSDAAARLRRLRDEIATRDLDQLLVTDLTNVRYLSGFTGTNATLLVGATEAALLTDFRYLDQAGEQAPGWEIVDTGSEPRERLAERAGRRIGFDDANMTVASFGGLKKKLPSTAEMIAAGGAVEKLRAVKDEAEIAEITSAAAIADSIYATLAEDGLVGRTEEDVAWRIEVLARERGAEGLSFPPIVAAGSHGALPHAEPRDVTIDAGRLVVLDLGVKVGGYCSDCTRTFATGPVSESEREVYEIVLKAQQTALDAIRAGMTGQAADSVARESIQAEGHGDQFGHSLGHGVGLEVHEAPTLSSRSENVLEAGNVVTVEPGIYIPGEFGVRIEDLVAVEADGLRVLSGFTKELTYAG